MYHFTIENRKLVKGIFEIKNEKIQEKKQGRIQAFYERKMRTSGFDGAYKTASGYRMKTGDNSRILEILAATGLSFLAAGWCFLNGINDSEKRKRLLWFMGILMGTVLLAGFSAAAQEIQEEEHYYVSEEIIYRDIQGIEDIPQTAWILVKDPANGKRVRRLFPLEAVEYMDGFYEEPESGKNAAMCRAVYGGLVARENAKALSDDKGEYLTEEYFRELDAAEPQKVDHLIWLLIPVIFGSIILIWSWKRGYIKKVCLLIRKNSLAFGIFFAILAVSGVLNTGKILKEYKTAARSYENMRKEVQSASIDEGGTEPEIDEEKLKKINPDYSFWIRIPGTSIDYPVVWGKEEAYYLDHGFDKEKHLGGAIFADSARIPFVSANTIVYGHNMKDGSMFSDLKKYKDTDFTREHPYVEIYRHGKWISCPVTTSKVIEENEVTPYQNGTEKLLTLSTCYGKTKRMVVQARVIE